MLLVALQSVGLLSIVERLLRRLLRLFRSLHHRWLRFVRIGGDELVLHMLLRGVVVFAASGPSEVDVRDVLHELLRIKIITIDVFLRGILAGVRLRVRVLRVCWRPVVRMAGVNGLLLLQRHNERSFLVAEDVVDHLLSQVIKVDRHLWLSC